MRQELTGHTKGLKASEIKALERIYRRRVPPREVVSFELAGYLCEVSAELHRQVGVLIDRRGGIEHVVVGDASQLMLPDVGRLRGGAGRFRGLRLVHTHLRGEPLTQDDLTDLTLLRLDLVAAIGVDPGGRPGRVFVGHPLPDNPDGKLWLELEPRPAHRLDLDVAELMASLEAEFARRARSRGAAGPSAARALLVQVAIGRDAESEARIAELRELCRTAGVDALDVIVQRRAEADPRFLVGRGKLQQILMRAMQLGADTVIFDQDLTPSQARAVSDFTELKILDRTMLILDIFAQHATSRDGKLQVELAQLKYALPRLAEKNTMMSRLTGGIGGRGPGETKLEIGRRRARERIRLLEKRQVEVAAERRLRRRRRGQRGVPIVAIVGYTNAGKSTLLNALTEGNALAEDKLFATLDPISRRLRFPREREVVLTDTVGFIRDLPADLVAAFRATLEELEDADLLVQMVDLSDADHEQQVAAVAGILGDLALAEKPHLLAGNKVDRLSGEEAERRAANLGAIPLSALDRSSLTPLLHAIERELWKEGLAEAAI
ncbi:MAG TPA: GTPase HflX [Candidatus Acidoferrum sp.]|nr:GTPase HflX [Candidatus Acidoferrum sp.]